MVAIKVPTTTAARYSRPPPPPSRPYKRAPTLRWSTSPLHLASSIMPAPWPLGAEAPPPVRHLLTVVRALVSGPPVVPRHALPVATLAASCHGPEQPLGRAPVSPYRQPLWCPRWNRGPATPTRSTDLWTWSTGFSLAKQFLEIPISGTLHLGPSSFPISTRSP
jgi:hypothetical protein